jgi:hypothetical protein
VSKSRWARLYPTSRPITNPRLRQGVWYEVIDPELGDRVVLQVRDRRVAVQRRHLEIRDSRPTRFTVVYMARNAFNPAAGTPGDLGRKYAVCPMCGVRLRLIGEPTTIQCKDCGHRGEVAWWETG